MSFYQFDQRELATEDAKKSKAMADQNAIQTAKALRAENEKRLRAGLPLVKVAKRIEDRKMVPVAHIRPNDFRRGPAFDDDVKAGKIFSAQIDGKLHVDREEAALAALDGQANVF